MHAKEAGLTPQLIEEAVVNSATKDGFYFIRRKTVQNPDTTNYCFEFTNSSKPDEGSTQCMNDTGEVYLVFWGNPRYKGDLYRVVSTLQKSK
jgi:hypothetical protein